jgi:hypothetical protein
MRHCHLSPAVAVAAEAEAAAVVATVVAAAVAAHTHQVAAAVVAHTHQVAAATVAAEAADPHLRAAAVTVVDLVAGAVTAADPGLVAAADPAADPVAAADPDPAADPVADLAVADPNRQVDTAADPVADRAVAAVTVAGLAAADLAAADLAVADRNRQADTAVDHQLPSCAAASTLPVDPMAAASRTSAVREHPRATSGVHSADRVGQVLASAAASAGRASRPGTFERTSVVSVPRRSGGGSAPAVTWALICAA